MPACDCNSSKIGFGPLDAGLYVHITPHAAHTVNPVKFQVFLRLYNDRLLREKQIPLDQNSF